MDSRTSGNPFVSIVIATYNRRDLVLRTVASALEQDLEELEVIVSDDGSTDGTVAMLRGIQDPRLRIHGNTQNTGVWANWAAALRMARGRYVVFLGDDDLLAPDFASTLSGFLDCHREVSVVFATLWLVDIEGNCLEKISPPFHPDGFPTGRDLLLALLQSRVFFGSAMFRRTESLEIWERCASDGMVADWGLILRLAQEPGFLAAALPKIIYSKTTHSRQLGVSQGGEVLRLRAEVCCKVGRESGDLEFRSKLLRHSALDLIEYGRHLAREGEITKCRVNLQKAVGLLPTSITAWSQFLQAYICPSRLARPVHP